MHSSASVLKKNLVLHVTIFSRQNISDIQKNNIELLSFFLFFFFGWGRFP